MHKNASKTTSDRQPTKWERLKGYLSKEFEIGRILTVTLLFLSIIALWMTCSYFVFKYYLSDPNGNAGTLGDSYGVVTSFFTALAFAGLMYTVFLQRKELQETRDEFKKQNITLKRQRFESTFFNMLSIHFKLLEEVKHTVKQKTKSETYKGMDAFLSFNSDTRLRIFNNITQNNLTDMPKEYSAYSGEYMWYFLPYIESLITILGVIKDAKFNKENVAEKRYLIMLRAYISLPEKIFLSYLIVLTDKQELRELDNNLFIVSEVEKSKQLDPMLRMYIDHTKNPYRQNK